MAHILIVDDEPILARNISEAMKFAGHETAVCGSGEDGLDLAAKVGPDIVILDLRLPGMDGLDVLRELRVRGVDASVVIMTAHGNIETAVRAMKSGAVDFITKPLDLGELQLVVDRVIEHRRLAARVQYFRDREQAASASEALIGESEPMRAVKRFIQRLVATPALSSDHPPSVLITGETGTGKDMVARALHYAGHRRDEAFIHVNCTAMPEHLVESELFGHVKGAFTDARGDKRGLFESADGGTIFLDEIGHMKTALQAKLLSVLEQRAIRPVGGTRERRVNVHVIAATNRDLPVAVQQREFREDLFHRLSVLNIHMPPLRDRGDDVIMLAEHFLAMYASRFAINLRGFSPPARELVRAYPWPGNVRELSHAIESAVLICPGPEVEPEHLRIHRPQAAPPVSIEADSGTVVRLDFSGSGPNLEEIEQQIIRATLRHTRNNLSHAARILGISRDAIRYRMERFDRESAGGGGADDEPAI